MTPIDLFQTVWQRCAQLSTLHAFLSRQVVGVIDLDELLRAEWAMRVGALDLFVHELVAQRMSAVFNGALVPTAAYNRFQISNETVDRIRAAISPSDAAAAFDLDVRVQFSRKTFQDPEEIAKAIRNFSDLELWNEIAVFLGSSTSASNNAAKSIKRDLSLIVQRRNKIVHEGDLQPSTSREPWPISEADVLVVKDLIERIVRAIDALV